MEAVELAIPTAVAVPKLMGSEVLVGARVCPTEGEARESDSISAFPGPKVDGCSSLISHRGASSASELSSWIKKADTEPCRSSSLLAKEGISQRLDHGNTGGSIVLISGSDGKQNQRKVGKVPRNGSGSFKKPRMLQTDNSIPQAEADDIKMESDTLGFHLAKCSNPDKSLAVKQKNNISCRRGDRRNSKVSMKAKYDPFSIKAGLSNFSSAGGGSTAFGMYGLKPEIHDITKLIDDISLDELLDGSYKCLILGKDKEKKDANTNNVLDSVRKACSILRLRGLQQGQQTEEMDINVNKNFPILSSPSNVGAANGSDGDDSSLATDLSKCSEDQDSSTKVEAPSDINNGASHQPRDILERLALPAPKDLESLLQEATKPAGSTKLTDQRSCKPLSHRISLPPFPWSHNFNGNHKSNSDAIRISNRSTCQGRWVRIRSTANFLGGGDTEGFVDLDSLTYDDSLVPAGQLRYRLPESEKASCSFISQHCCQQDSNIAVCPTASLLPPESGSTPDSNINALHSPTVLAAAQTLYDIAKRCSKQSSKGILKWPKQPSQKAMKARKSRSNEKPEQELPTPKSEMILDHVVRSVEYGSSSKKPKLSMVERRDNFSHIHTVIGLTSVSAPRSNRSSPSRLSRDSVTETRHSNGNFAKPSFMVAPPSRVMDRSGHNPQKARKVAPFDWNRTRS